MNYINYNGTIIEANSLSISTLDRAYNYGDGLFETMVLKNGKILFLQDHISRISKGLEILDIQFPFLSQDSLIKTILEVAEKNKLQQQARIKLQVYRKQGGLVTPESSEANFHISASPLNTSIPIKSWAVVSENIHLHPTILSPYKTLNFLPYIAASIEKKKRKADEIILTDTLGNIAEACSSNLFWAIDNTIYTPSLATGCIDGIMRKQIIQYCKKEQIPVIEGLFSIKELERADLVFTSNVTGLSLIEKVNNTTINTEYTLYQSIRLGLDLL